MIRRHMRGDSTLGLDDPAMMDLEDRLYAQAEAAVDATLPPVGLRCSHCGTKITLDDSMSWITEGEFRRYCGHYCFHMARDLGA